MHHHSLFKPNPSTGFADVLLRNAKWKASALAEKNRVFRSPRL